MFHTRTNMIKIMYKSIFRLLLLALVTHTGLANEINLAKKASVSASSHQAKYLPKNVNDEVVSDQSRWLAGKDDAKPWVELSFPEPVILGMIDVFSGWGSGGALGNFDVAVQVDGKWEQIDDWKIRGNKQSYKRVYIDRRNVAKLRLSLTKPGAARIREIAAYDNKEAQGLKDMTTTPEVSKVKGLDFDQHQIAVNQIGYFLNQPKRFTAPLSKDGTSFSISAGGDQKGVISR